MPGFTGIRVFFLFPGHSAFSFPLYIQCNEGLFLHYNVELSFLYTNLLYNIIEHMRRVNNHAYKR